MAHDSSKISAFVPQEHQIRCVLTNTMKTKCDIVLQHVFNLTITKEILEHLFHTLGVSNFLLLKTGQHKTHKTITGTFKRAVARKLKKC